MLKIIEGSDVRHLDRLHIQRKGISSLFLMENAALGFVEWFNSQTYLGNEKVAVFCGAGNNGGDGFVIARLLSKLGWKVTVFTCFEKGAQLSPDAKSNFDLIPSAVRLQSWKEFNPSSFDVLIDAFLGVGLKGELRKEAEEIIQVINSFRGSILSVDVPSGLPSDSNCPWECVRASHTLTFAFPKLALLFPENAQFTGDLIVIDIGIEDFELMEFDSDYFFLRKKDIPNYHRKFNRFAHKGDFGKILLVAGSKGKMGAAYLSAKSALRTGSGLVTCLIPESERFIIQSSLPEAMVSFEDQVDFSKFDALGIGPGLGTDRVELLEKVLDNYSSPLVLDADALTILSKNKKLIKKIPKGSILTPHLGEFERLFGKTGSHLERLRIAKEFCLHYSLNLLIKGANSVICLEDGRQIFNSSGSRFMATAGSGDVLTGMLTSFLGQGYSAEQAMICGVFQHGLAGEIAGKEKLRSTIASDILEAIPETFKQLSIS